MKNLAVRVKNCFVTRVITSRGNVGIKRLREKLRNYYAEFLYSWLGARAEAAGRKDCRVFSSKFGYLGRPHPLGGIG